MPESSRKRISKTGLIIAASVAAVVFILGLVTVGFVNQASYYQYAAAKDGQFAEYAEKEIGQACRGVPINQLSQCFAKARIEADAEKRAYEHDQADLIAQRKAALWAEMMGLAALLGMGLSIVGVALVYVTFRATRDGNDIQKRIGEAQTRGYISIPEATLFLSEHKVPHIGFVIKNSGQSPGLNMRLKITLTLHALPIGDGEADDVELEAKFGGIYSVSATDTLTIPPRGIALPPDRFLTFKALAVIAMIECEWDDVFGQRRPDKHAFGVLIEEWPTTLISMMTFHDYLAAFENDKLRRMAKGEWEEKA